LFSSTLFSSRSISSASCRILSLNSRFFLPKPCMSVRLFVVWRRVRKKNVSRRKSKTNERTKKSARTLVQFCVLMRPNALHILFVLHPLLFVRHASVCVRVSLLFCRTKNSSKMWLSYFWEFESEAKAEARDQKKRVSFGPADKKRTQFNFLTEKVRARANKIHILLYAQQ
jgi:hypothetical protein